MFLPVAFITYFDSLFFYIDLQKEKYIGKNKNLGDSWFICHMFFLKLFVFDQLSDEKSVGTVGIGEKRPHFRSSYGVLSPF